VPLNSIVVGVGGQGILTLTRVLASSAVARGVKALVSETHGMSQRGGSVIVHLRIGDDVYAPLIPEGDGHLLIGLELVEAVRYSYFVRDDSVIIVNRRVIPPSLPDAEVPTEDELLKYLRELAGDNLVVLDASAEAQKLGNPVGANMYVLGYVAGLLSRAGVVSIDSCRREVGKIGKGRVREANIKIFEKGLSEGIRCERILKSICKASGVCRDS